MTKRASETLNPTQEINELMNQEDAGGASSPSRLKKNARVGGRTVPAEPGERVWRRRNKLTDSDGLMREHARLIAAMFKGKVSMETGETLSRAMARQAVMCKEVEDRELLIAMAASAEKLKQFRSMHATAIPASFEEKRR